METPKAQELIQRVQAMMQEMNTKQIDRKELVQILTVSIFSFKHCFLLGEPGVSKTGILEIFSTIIDKGKTFDICIKNDTKYEEIFGDRYRDENGKLFYDTTNSIVEAEYAIIDETWKGNSKVMNSLLSIMSGYRKIDLMGKGTVKVPLISVGGASNELPTDVEVRPLRDRFLFSYRVNKIDNKDDWIKFASRDYDRVPELKTKFTAEEIRHVFELSEEVFIPDAIYNVLFEIRQKVVLLKIGVSERKFDQAIDVFKVSAFLNQRKEVNFSELFMLKHILWNTEEDIPIIKKILNDEIYGQLDVVTDYINSIISENKKLDSLVRGTMADFLKYRKNIAYGEIDVFESNKAYVATIRDEYDKLGKHTESVVNSYEFSMMVQQQSIDNIVSMFNQCPVYSVVSIDSVYSLKSTLLESSIKLSQWLEKNSELHSYNESVRKK